MNHSGKLLPALLCIMVSLAVRANPISIEGCIDGMPSSTVYLANLYAGRAKIIDSVAVHNGCFHFSEPDTLKTGLYYIILNNEHTAFLQLVINKEDIAFHSIFSSLADNMEITRSFENQLMYDYVKQVQQSSRQIAAIQQRSTSLTHDDTARIVYLNEKNTRLATDIITRYPALLLSSILKAGQPIRVPDNISKNEKNVYQWAHYFDNIDLNNTALVSTDVLSNAMLNYLAHYEDTALSFNEQSVRYAMAVDSILYKTKDYTEIHEFYFKELSDRYRYGDYDLVCAYTEEYYGKKAQDMCDAGNLPLSTAGARLAAIKHASVGKPAPAIDMPDYDGKTVTLGGIPSDYVLIVFWSSYCSHCLETLPKIKQIYDHRNSDKLEILSISMDTDKTAWLDFVKNGGYSWMNYCDLKGWEGMIPKSYNVQGTPTYILLNKNRTIIAKPATLTALAQKLKSLDLF